MLCSAVAVLALVSIASANQWQIEVVDTSGTWSRLQLGIAPSGVIHLCYSDSDQVVCHAYKDSQWHQETVGTFPSLEGDRWIMDVGRHNELGLVLNFVDGSVGLLEKHDSEWTRDSVPITTCAYSAYLSWDSAGRPTVAYIKEYGTAGVMGYAVRSDSGWICETIPIPRAYIDLRGLVRTDRDEPCALLDFLGGGYPAVLYIKQDGSVASMLLKIGAIAGERCMQTDVSCHPALDRVDGAESGDDFP